MVSTWIKIAQFSIVIITEVIKLLNEFDYENENA